MNRLWTVEARRVVVAVAAMALVAICATAADEARRPDRVSLKAFVSEARDHVSTAGRDQALVDFSDPDGAWVRGELYMFAYDFEGEVLAHGDLPHLVGQNLLDLKDPHGLPVIKELMKRAATGRGFLRYHWKHPTEGRIRFKLGHVLKIDDDWWIGSGIYLPDPLVVDQ